MIFRFASRQSVVDDEEPMMDWYGYDGGAGFFGGFMAIFMVLFGLLTLALMVLAIVWLAKEIQRKK